MSTPSNSEINSTTPSSLAPTSSPPKDTLVAIPTLPSTPDSETATNSNQALKDLLELINYDPALHKRQPTGNVDTDLSTEESINEALRSAYLKLLRDTDVRMRKLEQIESGAETGVFRPIGQATTNEQLKALDTAQARRLWLDELRATQYAENAVRKLRHSYVERDKAVQTWKSWYENEGTRLEAANRRIEELEDSYWYKASLLASAGCDSVLWVGSGILQVGSYAVTGASTVGQSLLSAYSRVSTSGEGKVTDDPSGQGVTSSRMRGADVYVGQQSGKDGEGAGSRITTEGGDL